MINAGIVLVPKAQSRWTGGGPPWRFWRLGMASPAGGAGQTYRILAPGIPIPVRSRDRTRSTPRLALPSESQWEAGCRAGATSPFHCGDTLDTSWANFDGGYIYGPGRKGSYRQRPVPVGFFGLVNRWGLAEMHGQMFEWCGDQWHPDPVGEGWSKDGTAWEGEDPDLVARGSAQKASKLLRGGSWINDPHNCGAASRISNHPGYVYTLIGVRPCCLLPPGLVIGS